MIDLSETTGRLAGRVALVTGAASGIGRAVAIRFAAEGARVVVSTDADIHGAEETIQAIERTGGDAAFVRADVSSAEDVRRLVSETVARFGRLDCAVNNAGITGPTLPTAELEDDDWDRITAVNLKGAFLCLKYEIRQMLSQGNGGAIVNLSSVAGLVGSRINSAYCASKHGVVGLSRKAAIDYAAVGIRVNAVCPGLIQTPMVDRLHGGDPVRIAAMTALEPVGRFGSPEEAAAAIVWLCLPESSFVTGIAMPVDGGFLA
jgi:NAD(P)-dependent dehydrogenase (short-subunit alcohol dehydrogenase family)